MKAKEVIPIKKEFLFITKIAIAMVLSIVAALVVLYLFLNKPVEASYRDAFQTISGIYNKMNIYIVAAVLVQLFFSSGVVYVVSLFYSHKIAGPMYRLKAVLQEYMDGKDIEKVTFRKTDFIPGVSHLFTDFFIYLGERKKLLKEGESLIGELDKVSEQERKSLLNRLGIIIRELEG